MKVNSIIFATGNKDKLREAEHILGIEVKGTELEVDEIQSLDPIKVVIRKARDYYKLLGKPVFVEDSTAIFKALNKLPGPYLKDFYESLGNEGITKLLDGKDRTAEASTIVVYVDNFGKEHVFIGKLNGSIAKQPRGDKGWGWDPVFIPEGSSKTFGEMEESEKNKYSMRAKALKLFKKWLDSQEENQGVKIH